MKDLKIDTIAIKFGTPTYLTYAIDAAMKIAKEWHCICVFGYNGIKMAVTEKDTRQDLVAYFEAEWAKLPPARTYKEKHNA